jgi:hypothetical protein
MEEKEKEKKGQRGLVRGPCAWPTWPRPCTRTGRRRSPASRDQERSRGGRERQGERQGLTCEGRRSTAGSSGVAASQGHPGARPNAPRASAAAPPAATQAAPSPAPPSGGQGRRRILAVLDDVVRRVRTRRGRGSEGKREGETGASGRARPHPLPAR